MHLPTLSRARIFTAAFLICSALPALAQIEEPKPVDELTPDKPRAVEPEQSTAPAPTDSSGEEPPVPKKSKRAKPSAEEQADAPEDSVPEPPSAESPKARKEKEKERRAREEKEKELKAAAEAKAAARTPPKPILVPKMTDADLLTVWEKWRKANVDLDQKGSDAAQAQLLKAKDELGINDLEQFSVGLARAADVQRQAKNPSGAVTLAGTAVALAPHLPYSHVALALAYFSAEPTAAGRVFAELKAASEATVRDPRYLRPLLADLGAALIFALTSTAIAVVLTLFLRRVRYFLHDFHHLFPRPAARWQSGTIAFLLLLLPVGLHLGVVPVLLTLLAAVALYLSTFERVLAGVMIAALGALPYLGGKLVQSTSFAGTVAEDVSELERADLRAREAADHVLRRQAENKAQFAELFALGRYELRRGQLDRAIDHLKAAAAMQTNEPRVLTNLATAMLARGDADGALELYKSATQLDATLPESFFDLGKLYYRRAAALPDDQVGMELDKAHTALSTAQRLDESLLTRQDPPDDNPQLNRLLLSPALRTAEITALADPGESGQKVESQISLALVGPVSAPIAWAYPAALALLCIAFGLAAPRLSASKACDKCGRAVCRRCDPEIGPGGMLCGQCINVFARKGVVPAPVKVRKQLEIDRHRSRMDRLSYLFGLLCSGAGHVFSGFPLRGTLYAFAFTFIAFSALFRQGVLRPPYGALPQIAWLIPLGIALVAVYLLSLRGLYKEQS